MKALKMIVDNKQEVQEDMEKYLKMALKRSEEENGGNDLLLKRKEKIIKEKSKLLDLCINEIITQDEFNVKNKELNERINKINKEIKQQQEKEEIRENIEEIINKSRKVIDEILDIKKISKNVCKELVNKVVIHSKRKFDFYIKGCKEPYFFGYESDISYLQRLL